MARHITDKMTLWRRAEKMLPAGIPTTAIAAVEIDDICEFNGYWIYLDIGYICTAMWCHAIHEDTLAELKKKLATVKRWPDDPELRRYEREVYGMDL